MKRWKLENAKNQFSEVVRRAMAHEPQLVSKNGRDAVVVVSADDYQDLAAPRDLVMFMSTSPLAAALSDGELELERNRDIGRDVDL